MYYHASSVKGITQLTPQSSNHGIPLVYFSTKRENVLVYLSNSIEKYCMETGFSYDGKCQKWGPYGFGKDGRQRLEEYYPNALISTYKVVSGYIYSAETISDSGFSVPIPDVATSSIPVDISGVEFIPDAYEAILQAEREGLLTIIRYEEMNDKMKAWSKKTILEEYEKGRQLEKRPRILITGCPMGEDTNKIVEAIENNGGVVVGFENCTGAKAVERMVDEDDPDVYGAIARKYFSIGCAIMTPNNNRIHLLGEMIDDYHVDGVVEMILSGCHSVEMESISVKNFVNEEKHLPYLAVVTDYSKGDVGQLNTRLAAFVEMIRK